MASSRYIATIVRVIVADVERDAAGRPHWKPGTDRVLGTFGGVWDRRRGRFVPPRGRVRARIHEMRFHAGQEAGARWFVDWLRRFLAGDWKGAARDWSALLVGGRRSGKTHLATAIMIVFAIAVPKARLWAISPTLETGNELDEAFAEQIPRQWVQRHAGDGSGRATEYRFANGSSIRLRSAVNPARLKAGRADITLLNEGQEMTELAYLKVRAAAADKGGLVLIAANPPDRPIGKWIEQQWLGRKSRRIEGAVFEFDPRRNPFIEYAALAAMAAESTDEKTFQRDVLGLFVPIGDTVFYDWDDNENWIDPQSHHVDVTAEITAKVLGRAAGDVVGMDFQRVPAMVGCVCRWFHDPAQPGVDLLWVVDEAVVDEADENDLVDALEAMPRYQLGDGSPSRRDRDARYRGWVEPGPTAHAACVIDASGFFQDGDHNQGRTSDLYLKARRWAQLYPPQKDSDRNPAIVERMKLGNSLIKSAAGQRRLFVARHCERTAEALRNYENKNGVPNRRSQYAHIVDAVTYVAYRFVGRPKQRSGGGERYVPIGKFSRGRLFPR